MLDGNLENLQSKLQVITLHIDIQFKFLDKLDRGMFERQRDIYLASNLPIYRDPSVNVSDQRDWLNKERDSLGYYAWIGIFRGFTAHAM